MPLNLCLAGLEPAIVSDMLHNMLREMMGHAGIQGAFGTGPVMGLIHTNGTDPHKKCHKKVLCNLGEG